VDVRLGLAFVVHTCFIVHIDRLKVLRLCIFDIIHMSSLRRVKANEEGVCRSAKPTEIKPGISPSDRFLVDLASFRS